MSTSPNISETNETKLAPKTSSFVSSVVFFNCCNHLYLQTNKATTLRWLRSSVCHQSLLAAEHWCVNVWTLHIEDGYAAVTHSYSQLGGAAHWEIQRSHSAATVDNTLRPLQKKQTQQLKLSVQTHTDWTTGMNMISEGLGSITPRWNHTKGFLRDQHNTRPGFSFLQSKSLNPTAKRSYRKKRNKFRCVSVKMRPPL